MHVSCFSAALQVYEIDLKITWCLSDLRGERRGQKVIDIFQCTDMLLSTREYLMHLTKISPCLWAALSDGFITRICRLRFFKTSA